MQSLLAKDWVLEVNTADLDADCPVWVPVRGLTSFAPEQDNNTEDDSSFDDGGWGSDIITQRKWTIEVEGFRKRQRGTREFVPDPGQEFLRKAAHLVAFEATFEIRWYRRDGAPDAYRGFCTVSEWSQGGEVNELEPINFTLAGQGEPTQIPNPAEVHTLPVPRIFDDEDGEVHS
jgi:hypothetical protein